MAQPPILNRAAKTPNSAADYIAYIEDLARRNKGGGTLQAYDQASNAPYVVPGTPALDKAYDPVANMQYNPVRPGLQAKFVYDGTSGDYVDQTTGQRYSFSDLQRQIKPPDQAEIASNPGLQQPSNPVLPNVQDMQQDSGDLIDSMPSLQDHMNQHSQGMGQVMGATSQSRQLPPSNPFGISPAISKLFNYEPTTSPYTDANLAKSYQSTPTGGAYMPQNLPSIAPASTGQMAYKKPEVQSLAAIDPNLASRDKTIQGIEQNIAGLDKQYQDLADPQNISHQSLSELKNLMIKQSGTQDATSSAEPVASDLPLRSSLNQPVKGDLPAAGQGIQDLQGMFAPLEKGTQSITKRIQDINPFKKIGEASASLNGALDNGGKAIAQGADALKSKLGTVASGAAKAVSNSVAGVARGIDNTKPNYSATLSKNTNVGKTSTSGGSSNINKSPSPGGQSVYTPPKVTYAPISTYKAPPKATVQPTPKPQPKASPAPNPVAVVVNLFKKLFGK